MTHALSLESATAHDRTLEPTDRQQELRRLASLAAEPVARNRNTSDVVDLHYYWSVLLRRKWTLVVTTAIALIVGLVETYNTIPLYRSSLSLQIELPSLRLTGLKGEAAFSASFMNAMRYHKTQESVLKSRAVAKRVVDQLEDEGLLTAPRKPPIKRTPSFLEELENTLKAWIKGADERTTQQPINPVEWKSRRAGALAAGLRVYSDPKKSQITRLSYVHSDPQKAAAIVNAFADNFIQMKKERRYDAMSYADRFLNERIVQVRANLEDSEQRLITYARERKIVDLDNKLDTLMQTLDTLNQKLAHAEADRIAMESEYAQSLKGKGPAVLKIMNSEVIQALKRRKGELALEYEGQPKIYKADYPAKRQLRRQITEIDQQIKAEVAAVTEAIKAGHAAKQREEASLQALIRKIESDILALRDRSTDYQVLKREVDTNRKIYENLLQRIKEVDVASIDPTKNNNNNDNNNDNNNNSNISIIDRALAPRHPFKPNLSRNLTIALGVGLAGGLLLVFLFEYLDDTIKTGEEVENRIQAPVLGIVPLVISRSPVASKAGHIALSAADNPRSPLAEAARSLATSLSFSTVEGTPKTMYVTSASPSEGKTTIATNIAIALANAGKMVLQIDADLRSPSLHHVFDLPNTSGLTNYLAGNTRTTHIAQPTRIAGLVVITSGPLPPNPVELLASTKMFDLMSLATERFDFAIIDGPPVIGLADAIVLSKLARSTILVATVGQTRYGHLEGAVKRLRTANANIVGAVVNRFDQTRRSSGYGYGYRYSYDYHYSYDYGTHDQAAKLPERA
ncbi:GumC family protein [Candidatus Thiosymbion oneisti]|uniref:GumC family protein n=1 Tax=Candidatus Thiosymbion oneisti TaxID=589554 RepID=UPI000B7C99DC|nr:polysaccharide biosynthesis tyrosine autokinase [Candidatus Thiosymbion oneisti]